MSTPPATAPSPSRGRLFNIRALPAILTLATVVAGCSLPMAVDAPGGGPAPGSFDRPFYAGAFLGDAESRMEGIDRSIADFSRMVGKQPALVKTFRTLGEDFSPGGWVGQLMTRVETAGSTNYVALDLGYPGAPGGALLDAIAGGAADAMLAVNARQMRSLGFTILLSPGWEMNGRWNGYAWQGHANGGERGGPAKYVAAFRRIVDIYRREGASNVKWVWSPNVGNAFTLAATGPSHWNWYGHYYPGDGYVDFLGPHGYNGASLWGGAYQEFEAMFDGEGADHTLSDMESRYPGKPIIVGEYATEEMSGRSKAEWIRGAFDTMQRHPRIVGAIWFQMRKETDWRIDSSGGSLAAYRAVMADPMVRSSYR